MSIPNDKQNLKLVKPKSKKVLGTKGTKFVSTSQATISSQVQKGIQDFLETQISKGPTSTPTSTTTSTSTSALWGKSIRHPEEGWITDTESVDLEALITHEGTMWADEQSNTGEMTWADRVARQEQSLLSQTAGVSSAQPDDFVIPRNMTSRCSPRGRAHGGPPLRGGHQWTTPDNRQDYGPNFDTPAVQHKAEVAPVFLAYNRVSTEGHRISLIQIVTSVC